jgi:hypothetical protein
MDFAPYQISKKLSELKFNYFCFAKYTDTEELIYVPSPIMNIEGFPICAPLWSQVFDWFLEIHNQEIHLYKYKEDKYFISINNQYLTDDIDFKLIFTKSEAQLKAFEICTKKIKK